MDDLLVLSKNPGNLITQLQKRFSLTSNAKADSYLGCDIHQSAHEVAISLCTYLEKKIAELDPILQRQIFKLTLKPFNYSEVHKMAAYPAPTASHLKTFLDDINKEDVKSPNHTGVPYYELPPLKQGQFDLPEVNNIKTEQQNPMSPPIKPKRRTPIISEQELKNIFTNNAFRSLMGIINYAVTKGRFDIQGYASILSQYTECATIVEFRQAIQILQYLYTTRRSGPTYLQATVEIPFNKEIVIDVYTDASDKKENSQGGYIILVNGYYVESKSFRISVRTASSYEAEIIALRAGVVSGQTLVDYLKVFGYSNISIHAHCDNLPALNRISGSPKRNKSVFTNCLEGLRWSQKHERVKISHISGDINPADLLTKPLESWKLIQLLQGPILARTFHFEH